MMLGGSDTLQDTGENWIGRGTCGPRCYGNLPLTLWKVKPERVAAPLSR